MTKIADKWFSDKSHYLQSRSRSQAESPEDVILSPHTHAIWCTKDTASEEIVKLFAAGDEEKVKVDLIAPKKQTLLDAHRKDRDASIKFWEHLNQNKIPVTLATSDPGSDKLEAYRRTGPETMTAASYLALYYGINGDTEMLRFVADVIPRAVTCLIPACHDLMIRSSGHTPVAQQQQQGAISSDAHGHHKPSLASCAVMVKACAEVAMKQTGGRERLREIERGAEMITHYLAHPRGLGKYLGKYADSENKAIADHELEIAVAAAKSGHPNFDVLFVDGRTVNSLLVSNKTKWKEMLKDVTALFKEILPAQANPGELEYQAICIAILAVGVSNFGYQMVKRYETIEARAAKIIEIIGGVLGGLPHAGGIIAAVGTVGKSITDAIYEHKIDKVKVIKTLGKRITASFILEKADLIGPGAAQNESELYTRILSSIYGIALS